MSDDSDLDPRSVANYILVVRRHFGYETTNLELQKIAYFAHGKYLAQYGRKLIEGYFEAWEHGPVHPLIYREFASFGSDSIRARAFSTNLVTGERRAVPHPTSDIVRSHVVETVLQLRGLTAWQLREKSHAEGGPWHSVWQSAKVNLAAQVIIPDNVIRERYNRHILPIGRAAQKDDAVEDQPPKFDRSR
jgi:uncharacterized phage-associated protein